MDGSSGITTLLVDLDGTLVGNRRLGMTVDFMRHSYTELRKHAAPWPALSTLLSINKEYKRPPNGLKNDDRIVELASRRLGISAIEARKILKDGVMEIFPRLERHFFPMPGAQEFIQWAAGNYPLILATNPVWPEEIIKLRASWGGIEPGIFRMITHMRAMSACKPEPLYFREILEINGLNPRECLLVGNDLKMDLPATKVGIRTFIVAPRPAVTEILGTLAQSWTGSFDHLKTLLLKGFGQDKTQGHGSTRSSIRPRAAL
jgi:FMN phosphatase YigB (HAD superfamily)